MKTSKILEEEIIDMKISSLPTRPTAAVKYGGYNYSEAQMKAAFDKLPLFIIQRFNALIDDICATSGGIADSVKTGIYEGQTLEGLFGDVKNGTLASYLTVHDKSLGEQISSIEARLEELEKKLG